MFLLRITMGDSRDQSMTPLGPVLRPVLLWAVTDDVCFESLSLKFVKHGEVPSIYLLNLIVLLYIEIWHKNNWKWKLSVDLFKKKSNVGFATEHRIPEVNEFNCYGIRRSVTQLNVLNQKAGGNTSKTFSFSTFISHTRSFLLYVRSSWLHWLQPLSFITLPFITK